mgnify:CR=1 FL=1
MSKRPRILISSSVYDKQELLSQIYAVLEGIGYEVWMSDKGTLPINPKLTAFESCLNAVEECDLFLGIISGHYGTGVSDGENSITHQEFTKAIKLKKLRWFLINNDVLVVRQFVKAIKRYEELSKNSVCSKLRLSQHDPISDMRILTMYDEATLADKPLSDRTGNWVQHYQTNHDVLQFIKFQLGDPSKYEPVI